jgi:hypothetical protein
VAFRDAVAIIKDSCGCAMEQRYRAFHHSNRSCATLRRKGFNLFQRHRSKIVIGFRSPLLDADRSPPRAGNVPPHRMKQYLATLIQQRSNAQVPEGSLRLGLLTDSGFELLENAFFCLQLSHERTDHAAEAVIAVPDNDGKAASQLRGVARNDNPMLGKEATNLIDESGPVGDQTATNSMNGLDRQGMPPLTMNAGFQG